MAIAAAALAWPIFASAQTCASGPCGESEWDPELRRCFYFYHPSTTVCRAVAGTCDVTERCTGTSVSCPVDRFASSTVTCRSAAGDCDVAEQCTGSSAACPANGFQPATVACRGAAGACDNAEYCSGSSTTCPADGVKPAGTLCRASAGVCDVAETCAGSAQCPADGFVQAGTACRAATDACDAAETCTGAAGGCPADGLAPAGTSCRAAAGPCDAAETCTGASRACPADALRGEGFVCRAATDACDVTEICTGGSAGCPADAVHPDNASCENLSACVAGGSCQAGACTGGTDTLAFSPSTPIVNSNGGSVTLTNAGNSVGIEITGVDVQPADVFAVDPSATWPKTMAPGESLDVHLELATEALGEYEGTVTVHATACADLEIPVVGKVVELKQSGGGCGTPGGGATLAALAAALGLRLVRRRRAAS